MGSEKEREVTEMLAHLRDILPRLWFNLYQGSLQAGFNKDQAMSLVHTYILSQNPHGIKPDHTFGPPSDTE